MGASSLLVQAGCGGCDDDTVTFDSRPPVDTAAPIDADDTDADVPVATHGGTISILDVRINGIPQLGNGGQVVASFSPLGGDVPGVVDATGQIFDNRDVTTGAGCAAWVYDLTQGEAPPAAEDHGTLTIGGSTQPIPPCNFVGNTYLCIAGAGAGDAADSLVNDAGGPNTMGLIDDDAAFTAAHVGRYLSITGALNFRNNGAFPIVAAPNGTTLIVGNPNAATQADLTNVTYTIISGAGPVPTSPEFLADTDEVDVSLDAVDGDEFEDFTEADIVVGDNFSLTPAAAALVSATMPVDGSMFTLGCDDAVHGDSDVGPVITDDVADDDCTLTNAGAALGTIRVGAEIEIAGTASNNGTFTITARDDAADTITYTNATCAAEAFDAAADTYNVDDCGSAVVSVASIDFNDGGLFRVTGHAHTGTGPAIADGAGTCTLTNTGEFQAGLAGTFVVISGATTAANNGTFQVAASDVDTITFVNGGDCTDEGFAAGTSYRLQDDITAVPFVLPDPATTGATMVGRIFCAQLAANSVEVLAGASAAIMQVDPTRIRTTFVRGGLFQVAPPVLNRTNVAVGHAIAGFRTP